MLRLERTNKYFSVEARWPISAICTHPRVDVGRLPVVEHLARAACHNVVKILQQCAIGKVSEELLLLVRDVVLEEDTTLQLALNALGFFVLKLRLRGLGLEL